MKKGIKIALISLGSLLGLVVVTVAVACWLVFTPARLTSIVNKLSDKYLLCQSHFDKVDLTLFKTFPDAGLELHNVVLVNPTQGAPSDTLASISNLTVGINLKQFLASRQVVVHQIRIDNPSACLYIAPDGSNNFSVIQTSQDTSSSTTELPSVIQIEKVAIHHLNGSFVNSPNHMQAALKDLDLNLKGSLLDKAVDAQLKLDANRIALHLADSVGSPRLVADLADLALQLSAKGDKSDLQGELRLTLPDGEFSLNGTCYTPEAMRNAKGDLLSLMVPFRGSLDSLQVSLSKAYLQLLDYRINLDGTAQLARQDRPLTMDVDFSTNTWQVADLLPILPAQFTKWKKGMDLDARLQLQGRCSGTVSDSTLPLVHADVRLDKGLFALPKTLPNKVKNISADLTADLDLKHKDNSSALIRSLSAQMGSNKLQVKGKVDKLLGDMLIDAQIGGDLALDEVRELLPAKLPLSLRGDADVDLAVNSSLKHITHTDLTKIKAKGTLHFSHLDAVYDSIFATAPQLNVAVQLPVAKRSNKVGELLGAHITGSDLHVKMPKNQIDATIASPDIDVNLNNLLDKSKPLAAAFDIALGTLHVDKDSLDADAQRLALKGSMVDGGADENLQELTSVKDPVTGATTETWETLYTYENRYMLKKYDAGLDMDIYALRSESGYKYSIGAQVSYSGFRKECFLPYSSFMVDALYAELRGSYRLVERNSHRLDLELAANTIAPLRSELECAKSNVFVEEVLAPDQVYYGSQTICGRGSLSYHFPMRLGKAGRANGYVRLEGEYLASKNAGNLYEIALTLGLFTF